MLCPTCGQHIESIGAQAIARGIHQSTAEALARIAAKALGSLGGRTKGKTKARDVDYRELARLSHQKRRENKAKKHQSSGSG